MSTSRSLRIGLVGTGFMGRAHSHAWTLAGQLALPRRVEMAAVSARAEASARAFAARHGWTRSAGDWRELIEADDIDLIDICTPQDLHAEIAAAALKAGKHVLCEKPLAATLEEAEFAAGQAADAARRGVFAMLGFNYRYVPALALARNMIADGDIGRPLQVRGSYLQDWLSDPEAPATWRMDASRAGTGSLGDLGSHLIDMIHFLLQDRIQTVSASMRTFTPRRPDTDQRMVEVTVDDSAAILAETAGGVTAVLETSRVALGRKNALTIEISGTGGSIAFNLERLNELLVYDGRNGGFTRVLVTEPSHPYISAWWPAGHVLGWDHTFAIQAANLVGAIAHGTRPKPDFADGLAVQHVLDAAARSAADGKSAWRTVPHQSGQAPTTQQKGGH